MFADTIAAVSSPPGSSPRGIIRISGPRALEIAAACFEPANVPDLASVPGHSRVSGTLRPTADTQLPAVAYVFRAPRSYTREDVVELHMPGSPGLLALALDALLAAGARPAAPGEFTARAVRHGALDLAQAEGVAEMIYARSDAQLRAARRLLDGALSRDAHTAREELTDLRALVEAALDFADEDIAFIRPAELIDRLTAVAERLRQTARSDARAERLAEPPRVVLVGPANAGKSTLLNRLTGMDRAICSALAGTTRDVLAAPLRLPHGEVLLCDTAGLLLTPLRRGGWGGSSAAYASSDLDIRAHRATHDAAQSAELIIWLTDANALESPPADMPGFAADRVLVVLNKIDAATPAQIDQAAAVVVAAAWDAPPRLSARTGEGCDALLALMDDRLHMADAAGGEDVLVSADLRAAIADAVACIGRALDLARAADESLEHAELIAAELSDAAVRLGRLSGECDVEQLHDRIFSRFCVGK